MFALLRWCALAAVLLLPCRIFAETTVSELTCEFRTAPCGIDESVPRLSWKLHSPERGAAQTAYQVLVASSESLLAQNQGDLWDSGDVASDQSVLIEYAGKPLTSRTRCFWKVRIRDQKGSLSDWSAPAVWSMGLLEPSDWQAQWIGKDETQDAPERRLPARMLRKEFDSSKKIVHASAYFCGLGSSELYLNGKKIGDAVLSPAGSHYEKRVYYVTYDVTDALTSGTNAIGIWLGNGRYYAPRIDAPTLTLTYGFPKALLQLEITYEDGSRQIITTDESWKLTDRGPIIANNEYDGEEYDARREMPGWNCAGFDDSSWQAAQKVEAPKGTLRAQTIEPIRVTGTVKPTAIKEVQPGTFVCDMGQNLVGWCRLRVKGPAGTAVKMRFAETCNPDGSLYLANIRGAKVTDIFWLKGTGSEEVFEPRFTYHGFRFVEITGFPGTPDLNALEGCVVNDDLRTAGSFECSVPLVNQIYQNLKWGARGNYRSFPTDCPQRDERQGWTGDRAVETRGETFLFDVSAFYEKWLRDMTDSQNEQGSITDVCPPYWPIRNDSVTWPGANVIIAGMVYEQYGDLRVLERQWETMDRWMNFMNGFLTEDGIMPRDTYGDWCVPPEDPILIHSRDPARKTSSGILGSTYYYFCLKQMAHYANLLGKPEASKAYADRAEALKTAFNKKFFRADVGYYENGSQTSCLLPLAFEMVPETEKPRVIARLKEKILNETHGHVGTGLVGAQWLNTTLTRLGLSNLSWGFVTKTEYPSWGYMISQGATTVWELWNGNTADPAMNSGNHVMLVGDLNVWLHNSLAGIACDPEKPGFRHVIMRPLPQKGLDWVKAFYVSPYGKIESAWKQTNGLFDWQLVVPPNSTATAYLPASAADRVTENGKPLTVKVLGSGDGTVIVELPAGSYHFECR